LPAVPRVPEAGGGSVGFLLGRVACLCVSKDDSFRSAIFRQARRMERHYGQFKSG